LVSAPFKLLVATRRTLMIRKIAFAAFAATVCSSGAFAAEYYVVQEKATKKCKVVETRPSATETTWVQVGPMAFKTREEADKQVAVICKDKN
jgi:hypothetical protein